jgi:beta-glucosidase
VELRIELRKTSAAGMVLVKNDGTLPLQPSALRKVALIGPNASIARTLGGGSATVFPPYVSSPLEGLRAALGNGVEIVQATGVRSSERTEVAPKELLQLPDGSGPGV